MKLERKYFHSVHSYLPNKKYNSAERILELKDILYKYKKILETGYILPYNEIIKLYGETINRNSSLNLNGSAFISVSLHENSQQDLDLKMYQDYAGDVENAFYDFIIQEPSIVLSEQIERELKFIKYPGIYLERIVSEPISLEYMEAISIFVTGYLKPFFSPNDSSDYEKLSHEIVYRHWPIEYIEQLLALLDKSKYHVPLIDLMTGNEFKDNQEYRKVLSKAKSRF
ncbi:MAG: hypothetical protein PUC82_02345 [bacterium]|nr:hypothetical protein [bacterium]